MNSSKGYNSLDNFFGNLSPGFLSKSTSSSVTTEDIKEQHALHL